MARRTDHVGLLQKKSGFGTKTPPTRESLEIVERPGFGVLKFGRSKHVVRIEDVHVSSDGSVSFVVGGKRMSKPAPLVQADLAFLDTLRAFTKEEIHSLVVPKRTLARRQAEKELLTTEETDKAIRLARIAELAKRVFGDADKAGRWLRKPKRALGGEAPLVYLASETGARLVEEMLNQIDSGMLS